jgi:hypothetical protein
MERIDELQRATLVDQPWQPLRGAVIAERRMIAATLIENVPVGNRRAPRTPPAPPPKPTSSTTQSETSAPEPADSDPLEELARG